MPNETGFYVTSYCNFAHRLDTGEPIGHECYVIPPAALEAEMNGDFAKAIELIEAGKTRPFLGERTLPRHKGRRS